MAIESFDITDGTLPTGWSDYLGSHEADSGNLICVSSDASIGAFSGFDIGNASYTIAVDINPSSSTAAPAGLFCRFSDTSNHILCHVISSSNRIRLVEVVGGSNTIIGDVTPSGYGTAQERRLELVDDGLNITVNLDGVATGIDVDSTHNQGETIVGVRTGEPGVYAYDNYEYSVAGAVSKTITFSLASGIQGVSDVNYLIAPVPIGDSITSGSLNTSSSTVTINLDSFDSLSAGMSLMLIATDTQAEDDGTDVIGWDKSTVVEG